MRMSLVLASVACTMLCGLSLRGLANLKVADVPPIGGLPTEDLHLKLSIRQPESIRDFYFFSANGQVDLPEIGYRQLNRV